MAASWRPWRNLQFLDYSTGAVTSELEPELEPHYNTAAAYFPPSAATKDIVVTTSTDKGIVKVLDKTKKAAVATFKDAAGSGFYSVAVPKILPFTQGGSAQFAGGGGAIGERAPLAPPLRFVVTNKCSLITLDFQR